MSMDLNRVTILGNVGKDPEVKQFQDGGKICNFSVATSRRWVDKHSGEKREKTQWHPVVVSGKLVDFVTKHIAKGTRVFVAGELETRKWQDQNGNDRYITEIKVLPFGGEILIQDRWKGSNNNGGSSNASSSEGNQSNAQGSLGDDIDDDIPF